MSNVNTCYTCRKEASLDDSFGFDLAVKKLGVTLEQVERLLGRYVKGKNKGKLKGSLVWEKTERGGWDYATQSVIYPGSRHYAIAIKYFIEGVYAHRIVYTESDAQYTARDNTIKLVAAHLGIDESLIKKVEVWHNCLYVRFYKGSNRFVTKTCLVTP